MQDQSPRTNDPLLMIILKRPDIMFLAISSLFVLCFWIWFLLLRSPVVDVEKDAIEGRAIGEMLAACNAATTIEGIGEIFRKDDVKTNNTRLQEGVSAFVTILEISRNGLACHWDGVHPAQLTHHGLNRTQSVDPKVRQ